MDELSSSTAAEFSEALRRLCGRKRMSQVELARRLGMSRNTVGNWVRGNVLPDRARVADVINALRCTAAEEAFLLEVHAGVRIVPTSHNVPYFSHTRYFTGRKELLERLDHHLALQSPVALTQPISISGLGGIGKTQVALEYAHHHRRHYRHVLWAAADSRETLITEIRKLASSLDLPEKDEKNPNRVVSAVRDWLGAYPNWLLILDNVEDLSLVTWFMPSQPLGAVLLTTRLQTTEPISLALEVETMPKDEGALLLLRRTKRLAPDAPLDVASAHDEYLQAQEISQMLGGLPLALDQAGAYILGTRCALADYLLVYDKQHAALLARRAKTPTDHPHPESVTTTFSLAFERVQAEDPAAADLLRLCAFLAPDAIPEAFITEGAAHLGPVLAPVVADPYAFNEVIEVLGSLSLIQRDASERTLSLHRLVQVVLRDQMSEAMQQDWIARCLLLLDQAFPLKVLIRKHRKWLADLAKEVKVRSLGCTMYGPESFNRGTWQYRKEADRVNLTGTHLYGLMGYYRIQDQYAEAEPLYKQALHIREQVLGSDHPNLAPALESLATLYTIQSRYAEAEPLYKRALHIYEQALGPYHPNLAASLYGLAVLYHMQVRCDEAESLYKRAFYLRDQASGRYHPYAGTILEGLAWLYRMQGRSADVKFLCQMEKPDPSSNNSCSLILSQPVPPRDWVKYLTDEAEKYQHFLALQGY